MKKQFLIYLAICLTINSIAIPAHAFFGGGGLKGPIAVYSKNTSVDAATIANQINTLKQLEATLKNLRPMDSSTSIANINAIRQNIANLLAVQQQVDGIINSYTQFQQKWDETYGPNSGISGASNTEHVKQLTQVTENQTANAMQNAALARSQIPGTANNLNNLLAASQSAEGALAAAQIGNQIAGIQAQQLMQLIQMMSAQIDAQMAFQQQLKEVADRQQDFNDKFYGQPDKPASQNSQGAGMPRFK